MQEVSFKQRFRMKIAVVGATGLVGREIITVLEEQRFIPETLLAIASEKSIGTTLTFNNHDIIVTGHENAIARKPEIAIFSAGSAVSRHWAPRYAAAGITVIDNSSAWRMAKEIPLVVPEINSHLLTRNTKIIANPNCSTIQLVVVLAPLLKRYGILRVVVSTYQSVSGTGAKAVKQMENERAGIIGPMAYPHPIDQNIIPHGGDFLPSGDTTEEVKLVNETRKILNNHAIRLTGTVVRVPVVVGHAESVNIELSSPYVLEDVYSLLHNSSGIVVHDDVANNIYPTPREIKGRDEVFVGRIRRDESQPNTLNLFIVADNLRKGAATNAVQIARYLCDNNLIDLSQPFH